MPETRTPDTEYDQQHRIITEQVYDRMLTGTGSEFRTGQWSLHDGTIQIPTTNGSVHVTGHGDHLCYTHHHGEHTQVLLDMPTDFDDPPGDGPRRTPRPGTADAALNRTRRVEHTHRRLSMPDPRNTR